MDKEMTSEPEGKTEMLFNSPSLHFNLLSREYDGYFILKSGFGSEANNKQIIDKKCPNCSNITLEINDKRDLIGEFIEIAEKTGIKVEIISAETEEGVMLKESFGGIAALLRYKS